MTGIVKMTVVGAALAIIVACAGCSSDQPNAGVLPPVSTQATPSVTPSAASAAPTSVQPSTATALPRGWTETLTRAATSNDPKQVASAFTQAMFLADSRTDDGNSEPFARAAAVFGDANAAQQVVESAQPPIGALWAPMRAHKGWTTVTVEANEDSDAGSSDGSYAADTVAHVTFTDGRWKSNGGSHDVLVFVEQQPDHTWKVTDFRYYG